MTASPIAAFSRSAAQQPIAAGQPNPSGDLPSLLDAYERSLILAALAASGGHQRRAARLLGVGATTLHAKLKRLHLHGAARLGFPPDQTTTTEEFRWRGRLETPHSVEVRVASGSIRIEGSASGDEVEIVALKHGRPGANEPGVEVLVTQLATGLSIAAHYNDGRETGASLPGIDRQPPGVDLHVRVPADAAVDARTGSGDIDVVGLRGPLRLLSDSGVVRIAPA